MVLTSLAPSFGEEPSTGTPANLALPAAVQQPRDSAAARIHDMLYATTAADAVLGRVLALDRPRSPELRRSTSARRSTRRSPSPDVRDPRELRQRLPRRRPRAAPHRRRDAHDRPPRSRPTRTPPSRSWRPRQKNGIVMGVVGRHEHPVHDDAPAVRDERRQARPRRRRADPAPRTQGLPGGRPGLPDPEHDARHAGRRLVHAFGLRHPVRGRADAPEVQQPAPGLEQRSRPGRPSLRGRSHAPQDARRRVQRGGQGGRGRYGYKYYDPNDLLARAKAGFDYGGATINAALPDGRHVLVRRHSPDADRLRPAAPTT